MAKTYTFASDDKLYAFCEKTYRDLDNNGARSKEEGERLVEYFFNRLKGLGRPTEDEVVDVVSEFRRIHGVSSQIEINLHMDNAPDEVRETIDDCIVEIFFEGKELDEEEYFEFFDRVARIYMDDEKLELFEKSLRKVKKLTNLQDLKLWQQLGYEPITPTMKN